MIACHERFIADLRSDMKAVVEVVYVDAVQIRLLNALKLEPFPLWGKFKEFPAYLEWAHDQNDNSATKFKLLCFVVCAYHPHAFIFPWGARKNGTHQNLVMMMAARLAKMKVKHDYYQNLSYESRAKFEERVYKSKTGQLLGEQVVTNELSLSSIPGNSSGENAQRFYGLEAQTEMEKLFTEPEQSKELTLRRKAQGAFSISQNWKRLVRDVADNAGFPPLFN